MNETSNNSDAGVALSAGDDERRRALRRMKWTATSLLLVMSLVFAASYLLAWQPWIGYVRAFTEAAMVGALADWFAVTALFRHPLGLPIPHTAIIPRGKDQLGDALAAFVRRNFLTPQVLEPKLAQIDYGQRAADWLIRDDNAQRLSKDAGALLIWLLDTIDNETLRHFLSNNLHTSLRRIEATPLLARVMTLLTDDNRHQGLVDAAVKVARQQLNENRYSLRARIGHRTPWWMPEFVDEEIYDRIVAELESMLDRIGDNPAHPARQRFNAATHELIASMSTDPALIARGEKLKEELLTHASVQRYLTDSWQQLRAYLTQQLGEPGSGLQHRLERGVHSLGEALRNDPDMRAQINGWISSALLYSVEHYREQIASIISDTVHAWDAEATSRRIELQVGRDLQFIRINGTLVGGLAGLGIYALVRLLS